MENLKIEEVTCDGEIGQILEKEILCGLCPRYILVGEDRTCLGEEYLRYADEIKNFDVLDDDIWVTTYPKTGTTWTQEMVWLIVNNVDFEGAKKTLGDRFPFLEVSSVFDIKKLHAMAKLPDSTMSSVEKAKSQKRPRFIKTHLPFSLLPDQIVNRSKRPKIINVIRNPKDVCVSYYHHGTLCQGWRTDLENFTKLFMADRAMYGSFWKHAIGFWEHQDWTNLLIIKYEDMKRDLPSVIKKVAQFLNKSLTAEQIEALTKHLDFDTMKNNLAVNAELVLDNFRKNNLVFKDGKFCRSGTVGKYKEELNPEAIRKMDEWIKSSISGTILEEHSDYFLNIS